MFRKPSVKVLWHISGPLVWIQIHPELLMGTVCLAVCLCYCHRPISACPYSEHLTGLLGTTWSQGEQTFGSSVSSDNKSSSSSNELHWVSADLTEERAHSLETSKCVIKSLDWNLHSLSHATWVPLAGLGNLPNVSGHSLSDRGWCLSTPWLVQERQTHILQEGDAWLRMI